jgi:hypothetical protein
MNRNVKGRTATPATSAERASLLSDQLFILHKNMPSSDVALARWRRDVESKKRELAVHEASIAAGKVLHTTRAARRKARLS